MPAQQGREPEPHPALWLVPAALLVLALGPWPYGYFQLLRLVVCGASAFLAYREFKHDGLGAWVLGLTAMALLFNPMVPVHLARSQWAVIDLGAAVVLVLHFWATRARRAPPA